MLTTVLLDLDGTLTDPKLGITTCIRYALARLDAPAPADLDWCIGPPLLANMTKLLAGDEAKAAQGVRYYRERFATDGLVENEVYEGIESALRAFRERGLTLFVATAKPLVFAKQIVAHFKLDGYFKQVYGPELSDLHHDKTDLIAAIIKDHGVDPAKAVMVGDRSNDIRAAKGNSMASLGVSYGYGQPGELEAAEPDAIVASPAALKDWVLART